jgi:peptide/nickel transport system permease protein
VLAAYVIIALGVWLGLWGRDWSELGPAIWQGPSEAHWLGTNRLGQDILQRALVATATAFEIGLLVAVLSTVIGAVLGATAGYFGNTWVDELLLWLIGTLEAIPFYLFVAALAFALSGQAWAMHLAMIATFWTPTARVARAETQRIATLSFIEAARVSGLPRRRIIQRHVLPHLTPLLMIQATFAFIAAIKAEVVLSFLGIGVRDSISWGVMIAEASQDLLAGYYMNFVSASVFLFGLVMTVNVLADRLQDRLDPKATRLDSHRHA